MKLMTSPPHRTPIGPVSVFGLRLVRNSALALLAVLMIVFVGPVDAAVRQSCDWSKRGDNAFMLDVHSAVDVYTHIPKATREILKRRMKVRDYDDFAEIRRDKIVGSSGAEYGDMRFMHFGQGEICAKIDFSRWKASDVERGPVYCESGHCIIVPTVCRNVSLVTMTKPRPPVAELVPPQPLAELDPPAGSPLSVPGLDIGEDGRRGRLSLESGLNDPIAPVGIPDVPMITVEQTTRSPGDGSSMWLDRPWIRNIGSPLFGLTVWIQQVPTIPSVSPPASNIQPVPGVSPPIVAVPPDADGRMQIPPAIYVSSKPPGDPTSSDPGSSVTSAAPVPEPATLVLAAIGLMMVSSWARKRKSA